MVVPNFTVGTPGPAFSTSQLIFAAIISLVLYGSFVFVQTVRHRDYFLPLEGEDEAHASPPSTSVALINLGLLLVSLIAIVGLAKSLTPAVERVIDSLGAPKAAVGVAIALLVLMPESLAALRSAHANRLQTSLNLAVGSALASIGLTIPAVAAVSIMLGQQFGLTAKEIVLLALILLVGVITLGTGRTTILQGIVHLVIFAAFLFLTAVP
jgi:Ca2+:H+ antiporter